MAADLKNRRIILEHRGLIRDQAIGEAVAGSMGELEKLARHEVHLRRRFEKTLTMLIRLRELREHFSRSVLQNLTDPPPPDRGGEPEEPSGNGGS